MKITLQITDDLSVIKRETQKFRKQIQERQSEIEMLLQALKHYQKLCPHPGQKTGYNERDGLWSNACPVCGESH